MSLDLILDNEFCECGLPAELDRVVFMHSSTVQEPDGHMCIGTFRCPAGHWWNGEFTEVPEEQV